MLFYGHNIWASQQSLVRPANKFELIDNKRSCCQENYVIVATVACTVLLVAGMGILIAVKPDINQFHGRAN